MKSVSQLVIPTVEFLELYRLFDASERAKAVSEQAAQLFKAKAEELCRKYGVESRVVLFTH